MNEYEEYLRMIARQEWFHLEEEIARLQAEKARQDSAVSQVDAWNRFVAERAEVMRTIFPGISD